MNYELEIKTNKPYEVLLRRIPTKLNFVGFAQKLFLVMFLFFILNSLFLIPVFAQSEYSLEEPVVSEGDTVKSFNAPGETGQSSYGGGFTGVGGATGGWSLGGEEKCGPVGNGYRLCVPILGVTFIENSLVSYIQLIYKFSLGIAGLLVFIMIVWGGIQYTISAGNPALTGDAKDRIFQAIFGLILLALSFIILNTINPALVYLKEPGIADIAMPTVDIPYEPDPFRTDPLLDSINQYNDNLKKDEEGEQILIRRLADESISDEQRRDYEDKLTKVRTLKAYDQSQLESYRSEDRQKADALLQLKALDQQIRNAQTPTEKGGLQKKYNDIYFKYSW